MDNLKSLKQTSVFCEGGGRQLIINVLLQVHSRMIVELSPELRGILLSPKKDLFHVGNTYEDTTPCPCHGNLNMVNNCKIGTLVHKDYNPEVTLI